MGFMMVLHIPRHAWGSLSLTAFCLEMTARPTRAVISSFFVISLCILNLNSHCVTVYLLSTWQCYFFIFLWILWKTPRRPEKLRTHGHSVFDHTIATNNSCHSFILRVHSTSEWTSNICSYFRYDKMHKLEVIPDGVDESHEIESVIEKILWKSTAVYVRREYFLTVTAQSVRQVKIQCSCLSNFLFYSCDDPYCSFRLYFLINGISR